MADTKVSYWEANTVAHKTGLPCPKCGVKMVLSYMFLTPDDGQHQHTRYVCLSWPKGSAQECGWTGLTVPGWDKQFFDSTIKE